MYAVCVCVCASTLHVFQCVTYIPCFIAHSYISLTPCVRVCVCVCVSNQMMLLSMWLPLATTHDTPIAHCRFRSTACVAEFAADTSTNPSTLWQSEIGEDPTTITLGLEPPTSLSKVFIEFEAAVPRTTVLEYLHFPNRTWLPLQYFADDCQMRFGMETGAQ